MCKKYYSNINEMIDTALAYRNDWFSVERHATECKCGAKTTGFTVSEREDGDIIEKMICCPQCAKNQALTSKSA